MKNLPITPIASRLLGHGAGRSVFVLGVVGHATCT